MIKLTNEIQNLLFSYPVSSELREAVLFDDKDSNAFEKSNLIFKTDKVKDRSSRSYDEGERDKEMALAMASAAIVNFQHEDEQKASSGRADTLTYSLNQGKQS